MNRKTLIFNNLRKMLLTLCEQWITWLIAQSTHLMSSATKRIKKGGWGSALLVLLIALSISGILMGLGLF